MTRRVLALIVLVLFVSVPALELHCALACAHQTAAADPDGCEQAHHTTPAEGPFATGQRQCCHAAVTASVPATTSTALTLRPVTSPMPFAAVIGVSCQSFPLESPGRPPGPVTVPLRI